MNILVDIGHPAHVHMFHCFASEMQKRGHKVLFTCRDKEFEIALLQSYGLNYRNIGKKPNSLAGKILNQFKFEFLVWKIAREFHADIFLSHGSIIASHVSALMRKPCIAFEDTYNMEQIRIYRPHTDVILTADYMNPLTGWKEVLPYAGYHELLYLHPNQYQPNPSVKNDLGLKADEKYVIVRFVAWNATHDQGHNGITYANKIRAIHEFSKYARVFISSEKSLPTELEPYRFPLPPNRMHDAEAFASLVFGESATMVSEGVVMGTPGVYIDNTGRLYCKEQEEKYGMCYNYSESLDDQNRAIEKGIEILSNQNNIDYKARFRKLLNDKMDVTAWLCWFIENYPQSEHNWRDHRSEIEQRFK